MGDMYSTINRVLVELINRIWELEGSAIITEEFSDITNNDMHVIEAIGLDGGKNMSAVAKKLNITVSSLSSAINSLVRKKYVVRQRSSEDRRRVEVSLTERGQNAYLQHEAYHRQMIEAAIREIDPKELPTLIHLLETLQTFFESYSHTPR